MSFPKQEENRIRVVLFGSWRLAFTLYSEFAETLFGVTLPTSSSNQSLFVFNQIINCKFAVQCNQFAFDSPFPPSLPHSPHFRWVLVGLLFSFFFFFGWRARPRPSFFCKLADCFYSGENMYLRTCVHSFLGSFASSTRRWRQWQVTWTKS